MKINLEKACIGFLVGILLYCLCNKKFLIEGLTGPVNTCRDNQCADAGDERSGCEASCDETKLCFDPKAKRCNDVGMNAGSNKESKEKCEGANFTWCGSGAPEEICDYKLNEIGCLRESVEACKVCVGEHQRLAREAKCSVSDIQELCQNAPGPGPDPGPKPSGSGICDVNTNIENFPSKSASNTPLGGGSTVIIIQNRTGEDCYVYANGGIGADFWKHMVMINNNSDKTYYINDELHAKAGPSFGLFNAYVGECNDSIANKSLFEITPSDEYPSMDISFNAGFNYGLQFIATSTSGNFKTEC